MKNEMSQGRWMVVDDNREMLELMAGILETGGTAVARFHCASSALRSFATASEKFSLVVTDLEMPGMSGVELCGRVRELSPDAKILLVTGNRAISADDARRWGFCGLLWKPFSGASLWQAIESAFGGTIFCKNEAASLAA
jgi:CheY-like chemotaxis protein